jgi:hypothetical protein
LSVDAAGTIIIDLAGVSAEKGKKRESSEKGGTSRSSNNLQSELVPLSPSLARLAFDQTVGQSSRSEKVAAYHAGRQRQGPFFPFRRRDWRPVLEQPYMTVHSTF